MRCNTASSPDCIGICKCSHTLGNCAMASTKASEKYHRVRRHKSNPQVGVDGVDLLQQPHKVQPRAVIEAPQIVPVGVDGLAEQGNFAVAEVVELANFIEDFGRAARDFPAPRARHGAVGAFEVAAENHVHPRGSCARAADGRDWRRVGVEAQPKSRPLARPAVLGRPHEERQMVQVARAEQDVHFRHAAPNRVRLSLRHTTRDANYQVRLGNLECA